jgi:V8-like Glu-specific endopeptidase
MYPKFKFISVLAVLLLVLQMFGSSAQARTTDMGETGVPSTQDEALVTSRFFSAAEQKAATAFWTRQAITNAQALEIPIDTGEAVADQSALVEPDFAGEFGFSPAGAAASGADMEAQAAYAFDWESSNFEFPAEQLSVEEPFGTTQVYTSYIVNQSNTTVQTMYPHKWVGRINFLDAGSTYYCSGTAISGNVMVTAAHCLYNTTANRWHTGVTFTPAYRAGAAPYGSFTATKCVVLTAWINLTGAYNINTWAKHDVGVCKMGNNSSGQSLNTAVGYAGRSWNAGYIRHYHDMGYPLKNYQDTYLTNAGLYLRTCVAESFQQAADVRGMGCNWGGGISGGPWMTGYALGTIAGSVDGVNSGLFIGTQNMYGPRFTSSNIVPLCSAAPC